MPPPRNVGRRVGLSRPAGSQEQQGGKPAAVDFGNVGPVSWSRCLLARASHDLADALGAEVVDAGRFLLVDFAGGNPAADFDVAGLGFGGRAIGVGPALSGDVGALGAWVPAFVFPGQDGSQVADAEFEGVGCLLLGEFAGDHRAAVDLGVRRPGVGFGLDSDIPTRRRSPAPPAGGIHPPGD